MSLELELSIPPHFFDSAKEENDFESVSERIAKQFLKEICGVNNLRRGDEKASEPDYVSNDRGYEVTFAIKQSLIPQLKGVQPLNHSSRNTEKETISDIQTALERKKEKTYCLPTTLVIVTVETIIPWYCNFYFDIDDPFMRLMWSKHIQTRDEFFNEMYTDYIGSGIFDNIIIINPTIKQEFAVFSIKAFHQQSHQGITRVATTKPLAYPTYTITNVIKDDNFFQLKTTIIGYSPTI